MTNVVVSGIGAVTPFGVGALQSYNQLIKGQIAFAQSKYLNLTSDYFQQKNIAEVDIQHINTLLNEYDTIHSEAWATKFTLLAVTEALANAHLENAFDEIDKTRIGIAITTLESEALECLVQATNSEKQSEYVDLSHPEYCVRILRNHFGIKGPSLVLNNACASGNHAIAAGFEMIQANEADIVIVGGGCKVFKTAVVGFHQFKGITKEVCRPFDKNRSGTLLGDGAGILVLESNEHAFKRGFSSHIKLLGVGMSCDAYDMSIPHPEALGMKLCMERALANANLIPRDIQYINAHGTGTQANDRLETKAIKEVFGEQAKRLLISSTKALHGHCLYAASAIEAIWCCCVLLQGIVPATVNLKTADEECDLDYVANQSRKTKVNVCLNNSFGFGGANASVVFAKV